MYALYTYMYETRSLNFLKIEKVFTKVKDFHCNECPFPPVGIVGIVGKTNSDIIETGLSFPQYTRCVFAVISLIRKKETIVKLKNTKFSKHRGLFCQDACLAVFMIHGALYVSILAASVEAI